LADVRVNNDGDLQALHQQMAALMQQWRERFGSAR
jgi:dephospho-CoA kinase